MKNPVRDHSSVVINGLCASYCTFKFAFVKMRSECSHVYISLASRELISFDIQSSRVLSLFHFCNCA
jgi:hypothetical protein